MSQGIPNREPIGTEVKVRAVERLEVASRTGRVQVVKQIARELRVCERSVWRWFRLYGESGVAGLERRGRSDRGEPRWFRNHPDVAIKVWALWAAGQSVAAIYDLLWRELLTPPHVDTVRNFIRFLACKKVN